MIRTVPNSNRTNLTLPEMILLAAWKLEQQGHSPFSAEDLIVAAWKEFPKAFGLRGYAEQYPDANRVLSAIMGERGLAKRGWLAKVGQKLYSLSRDGQRIAKRILEGQEPEEETPASSRLPREQQKLLLHMLDAAAVDKFVTGQTFDLTFADACKFWDLGEQTTGEAVDRKLQAVEKLLDTAQELATKHGLIIQQREITDSDIELLRKVHRHLKERFSRHLMLLRSRN
ncbi:MAG: hypothetical protein RMI91_04890 [Gemmatales bacterium]|nr:hypothetical protein [Gemmatales bacterium]MDW7993972.1 hypothetical protein [Gemmatales bacterium]